MLLTMATALVLTGCGEPQSAGEDDRQQSTTTVVRADLESVARAWGVAVLTSDVASMVDLLEPTSRDEVAPQLEQLEALTPPGEVELRDLGVEVVTQDGDSAEVRYTGTRCAPTITKRFGPTTVEGGATDSTSLASDGVIVEGEVVCTDLATMDDGAFWPAKFVRIDGQWHGTLPGT